MSEFRLPFDANVEEFKQRLQAFVSGSGKLPHCDKCEGLVPPQNNAAVFEFINTFGHVAIYFGVNRHIQPVVDEIGVVIWKEALRDGKLFLDSQIQGRNISLFRQEIPWQLQFGTSCRHLEYLN